MSDQPMSLIEQLENPPRLQDGALDQDKVIDLMRTASFALSTMIGVAVKSRPADVQIDSAYANGVRAVLTRLAHTRRPEDDRSWKDCEAMELGRRNEIHALAGSALSSQDRG